jgi:hypothetical protein
MEALLAIMLAGSLIAWAVYNYRRPRTDKRPALEQVVEIEGGWRQLAGSRDALVQNAWRAFAEANGLAFVPDAFLSGNIGVSGEYRGHFLNLEVYTGSDEATCIRATLQSASSEEKVAACRDQLVDMAPGKVLDALLPSGYFPFLSGKMAAEGGGRQVSYQESNFLREPAQLKRIADLLSDLADGYPAVIAMGGTIAPALQVMVKQEWFLRDVAARMLKDIAQATRHLGGRAGHLLCPRCLVRCYAHPVDLPWEPDVTYFGCRACHQSREFIDCPKGVVAVLNDAWRSAQTLHNGLLGVNWLKRRMLFDFDRIEIVRATDKDVEHFAMQVGNDTDPIRKPRYVQMCCVVNPACGLSENTLRILENTFGRVDA